MGSYNTGSYFLPISIKSKTAYEKSDLFIYVYFSKFVPWVLNCDLVQYVKN